MDTEVTIRADRIRRENLREYGIEEERNQIDEDIESSTPLLGTRSLRGGKIVYACFMLLGLGTLLPWNFFITADSYWQYKFRNTSEPDDSWKPRETELQKLYDPMQVCLSQFVNFSFLFINALFSHLLPQRIRLLSSLTLMLCLFIVTTVFVRVDTDAWQTGFFSFTMIIIVLISASGATFQGGLFGVASMFPQKFINAVGVGQALGGVFASLTRIVSIYLGVDQVMSAFIYYLIAVIVMFLTLLEYFYVSKLRFFNHYINSSQVHEIDDAMKSDRPRSLKENLKDHFETFKLIWLYGVSVCFVFMVTLAVFPVLAVKVLSSSDHEVWAQQYFQPVCSFLIFNVFDYAGRIAAEFLLWPRKGSCLLYLFSALRVGFIPLFLLCNHNPNSIIPSVFVNDGFYIAFMCLFGLSNGYVFSLLMMYAPRAVIESEAEKVGLMMATMIGLGLLLGSLSSFAFALIS